MKLQILVPQYKETDEIVKPLLDSIAIQQNVDFDEIGVVIVNDGTDIHLSDELLNSYPFEIKYYMNEHKGVSATRNACLDYAEADYVMFCDADDMFYSACGLWILFREMNIGQFDTLVSWFLEETRMPETNEVIYVDHRIDSTFVHGKVHRRKYLINNNIRWNENLTIHEDSYFNILCQKMTDEIKYCQNPFYLWKWRDDSVCRHDPKYILKTYNNMLDSSTALVTELLDRRKEKDAQMYATQMIFDAYFTMNKKEWIDQENQDFRLMTEKRFKKFYLDFKNLFEQIDEIEKNQLIVSIKNRFYQEGMFMESITFNDWIKHIENDL